MDEQSIFINAIEKPTPAEREAFLEEACGENQQLRQNVDLLIRAYVNTPDFGDFQATKQDINLRIINILDEYGVGRWLLQYSFCDQSR